MLPSYADDEALDAAMMAGTPVRDIQTSTWLARIRETAPDLLGVIQALVHDLCGELLIQCAP